MAKIGIIIPVYNVEKYLRRCIASVLLQSFQDFEIILVNDGSTDQSGKICDEYARMDSRITVIHKENGGLSEARNYGLDRNNNEYIVFVDSDDYIDSRYLEILYCIMQEKHADIAICYSTDINEDEKQNLQKFNYGEIISGAEVISRSEAYRRMMVFKNATVSAWGKMYHRDIFRLVRYPVGELYEDSKIIDQIIETSNRIVYVPYGGYFYLVRRGSITHRRITLEHMTAVDNSRYLLNLVQEKYPEIEDAAIAYYLWNCLKLISGMIEKKEYKEECRQLREEVVKKKRELVFNPYISCGTKCSLSCLCIGTFFYKMVRKIYLFLQIFKKY